MTLSTSYVCKIYILNKIVKISNLKFSKINKWRNKENDNVI